MRRITAAWLGHGLVLALFLGTVTMVPAQRPEPQVHGVFAADTMYTLLPPDGIPAILEPEYVAGAEADSQMMPDEPVIGLAMGGSEICWSTWQLDHHEIVNDTLSGTAIAATW